MSNLADSIINFFMSKFLILSHIMFTSRNCNSSVRRTKISLNKFAPDQCIEQTVNREQKCRGAISGFSTSGNMDINQPMRSAMRSYIEK